MRPLKPLLGVVAGSGLFFLGPFLIGLAGNHHGAHHAARIGLVGVGLWFVGLGVFAAVATVVWATDR